MSSARAPTTTAETSLRAVNSAALRLPGLPACARRRSVRLADAGLLMRWAYAVRRAMNGRTVRSKNGCWSSSSSRFLACIEPSWVRRAWTGSTDWPPARPRTMSMIAAKATTAKTRGSMAQTSMSTMRRMARKPMSMKKPPTAMMQTPRGRPRKSGGLRNIGDMKLGAITKRTATRPMGRPATT